MSVTGTLRGNDTPVRIIDRKLRLHDSEARTLLHALEHIIDSRSACPLHMLSQGGQIILLTHVLFRPSDGNFMVHGVGVHPGEILIGSLPKRFLTDMAKTYMDVEDLDVYQRLCKLHIEVCELSHSWPQEERYELGSQIPRSKYF